MGQRWPASPRYTSASPRGRYLTEEDLRQRSLVAVIGSELADKFFRLRDPLGATFRIDDKLFRVVGVLEPVGLSGGAGSALVGRDLNKDVHIPLTTAEVHPGLPPGRDLPARARVLGNRP